MPNRFPRDVRSSFKQIITASYNGKEAEKGADHRENLVFVCKWSMNTLRDHFSTTIFFYQCWKLKKFYILLIKTETASL